MRIRDTRTNRERPLAFPVFLSGSCLSSDTRLLFSDTPARIAVLAF
jgi:hypothetical protein